MKILHIGLFSHYTDGMTYQDNCLAEQNLRDGHEVTYITDAYCYRDGLLVHVPESDEILPNGLRLIRLEFDPVLGKGRLSYRTTKVKKLQTLLPQLAPDVILHHALDGYSLLYVVRYVQKNPGVRLYVDSHADFNNTAQNLKSVLWHKCFTRTIARKALPYIEKMLYVSLECKHFLQEMYGVPENKLEEFLLGGSIIAPEQQTKEREKVLRAMGWPADTVIFAHSGKLTAGKKTKELLLAYKKIENPNTRLLIFGSLSEEIRDEVEKLIKEDDRVCFLGWKSDAEEIKMLLCAADIYIQPGEQSATVQVAACCGCAEILPECEAYHYVFGDAALYIKTDDDFVPCLKALIENEDELARHKEAVYMMAQKKLDYRVIAQRYLHGSGQ